MASKLSSLKSLDGSSVDRADCGDQTSNDITWRRICRSQIESTQTLRSAYLNDIKSVH